MNIKEPAYVETEVDAYCPGSTTGLDPSKIEGISCSIDLGRLHGIKSLFQYPRKVFSNIKLDTDRCLLVTINVHDTWPDFLTSEYP